ncbi:MAG: type I restriction enzyme subunit R domain-containing protein, partial [Candidatus Thorarchaeota archaeon]
FGGKKRRNDNPTENEVVAAFNKKNEAPYILIVTSKLLTGFDAPVESTMYLDNPLTEHNLLQAIARTNRVLDEHKQNGLIVDYVGVTKNLTEALSSYRKEDVQNALLDLDGLRSELRQAHHDVMAYVKPIRREAGTEGNDLIAEFNSLFKSLDSLDNWLSFKRKVKFFIRVYSALSPDPSILEYTQDVKWMAMLIPLGTFHFEQTESPDLTNYSGKIREMLKKELDVTGLSTVVAVRSLTDPEYWNDFRTAGKSEEELETVAVRKVAELKRTIREKRADNEAQYSKFSERLKEIIEKIESNQLDFMDVLLEQEKLSKDIEAEGRAHEGTGLTKTAHGIYNILEAFTVVEETQKSGGGQCGECDLY